MGNSIGGRKEAKIMKIDGETFRVKMPATAMDVLKNYPESYVLLESESVKKCGIRAPQLQSEEELKPKQIYFLVEMPKFPEEKVAKTGRARSAVHISSAQERLKWLVLRERSASDISGLNSGSGPVRIKMRLPRAQIDKLMEDGKTDGEVAERILDLCLKRCSEEEAKD